MTDTTLAPAAAEAPSPRPAVREVGIIMNGVSGRMGYRQHLVRSILAIRDQGGIELPDGSKLTVKPLLVGRSEAKLADLAAKHGIEDYTTDLDAALADPRWEIYADFLVTKARASALRKAIAAGKTIYTEKPTAETVDEALELARLAQAAGVKTGVVHDKLYLPGLQKLKRLIDSGFFGRILSVRGEFGYWVFEGDLAAGPAPSWNYRAEDGGGIIVDMFPHWNYVLENLFGEVKSVYAQASVHIADRWDEKGEHYTATAEDAAYGIFELEGDIVAQINSSWTVRVNRDELVEFHVDGTHGSAVVGLFGAKIQHRNATPKPVWTPTSPTTTTTTPTGPRCPRTTCTRTASASSGRSSSSRTPRAPSTSSTSCRAPAACSSPRPACSRAARAARSSCPPSRWTERDDRPDPARSRRHDDRRRAERGSRLRQAHRGAAQPRRLRRRARRAEDLGRQHPGAARRGGLGRDARRSAVRCTRGTRRRRRHGHRAAQHGPRRHSDP